MFITFSVLIILENFSDYPHFYIMVRRKTVKDLQEVEIQTKPNYCTKGSYDTRSSKRKKDLLSKRRESTDSNKSEWSVSSEVSRQSTPPPPLINDIINKNGIQLSQNGSKIKDLAHEKYILKTNDNLSINDTNFSSEPNHCSGKLNGFAIHSNGSVARSGIEEVTEAKEKFSVNFDLIFIEITVHILFLTSLYTMWVKSNSFKVN